MKKILITIGVCALVAGGAWFFVFRPSSYLKEHKVDLAVRTLDVFRSVTKILPIEEDAKKQIAVSTAVADAFLATDHVSRRYLILLQNNMELRPGGGFLGQYAVVVVKDGAIESLMIEDANLLDQRIEQKVTPPWPLTRYLQIKKWKLRDSNWSPVFADNAAKAKMFLGMGGAGNRFDGVIAVNASVLNRALEITGPITVWGVTFDKDTAALKLEEVVEKQYLGDDVPAEAKQNRKAIMKKLGQELASRLASPQHLKDTMDLGFAELNNKDIQMIFADTALQEKVASIGWDGGVRIAWDGDYVMVVDANLGALKSDYYVKRRMEHVVDFTGSAPKAETHYYYNHTARGGDWRTSDWHGYVRMLVPAGSTMTGRVGTGGITTTQLAPLKKTEFGYKVDAVMGRELHTSVSYALPSTITAEHYTLLVQKQSGAGDVPLVVVVRRPKEGAVAQPDGTIAPENIEEIRYETVLKRDVIVSLATDQEKVSEKPAK